MSLIPNRKGQPMLVEWQVASRVGKGTLASKLSTPSSPAPASRRVANRGHHAGTSPPPPRRCRAPCPARCAMHAPHAQMQAAFSQPARSPRLEGTLADLQRLQGRQIETAQPRPPRSRSKTVPPQPLLSNAVQRHPPRVRRPPAMGGRHLTTEPQPWIPGAAAVCKPQSHRRLTHPSVSTTLDAVSNLRRHHQRKQSSTATTIWPRSLGRHQGPARRLGSRRIQPGPPGMTSPPCSPQTPAKPGRKSGSPCAARISNARVRPANAGASSTQACQTGLRP